MSRLSFRPRPLDIHKKLPIVKSVKDFDDDDGYPAAASTRNSHLLRLTEADNEAAPQNSSKRSVSEIPTPQFDAVDTYETDYQATFMQPASYLRGRGARAEIGEFVDYDLDDEDEDWLEEFSDEKRVLTPEKFETILFKLEVLDHKTRERAGVITPTFGAPVPVLLELETAAEALLQAQAVRFTVFQSVYNFWKAKRERWQKPILRHLQPPPPVNDTNPYNVFRPREKVHRLHTRRMQRRENNVQSFEKLRQVRRNLDQAKTVLKALIKREEKKREILESEVSLQRIQVKYKHEAQLVEDGPSFSGFPSDSYRYESSDDDYMDSDDTSNGHMRAQSATVRHSPYMDSRMIVVPPDRMKRELTRRPVRSHGWPHTSDPDEPVMLFTKHLDPDKLAVAGITRPQDPPTENGSVAVPDPPAENGSVAAPDPPTENGSVAAPYRFQGRIGRGGRIIFDRWNPLLQSHIGYESSPVVPANRMPRQPNG